MKEKVKEVIGLSINFSGVCLNFLKEEVRKDEPKSDTVIITGMVIGFLDCVSKCLDEEFDNPRAVVHKIDDILSNFLVNNYKDLLWKNQ
jgi:hypothetical protein